MLEDTMSHLQGIASNHIIDYGPPVLAVCIAQFFTAGREKKKQKPEQTEWLCQCYNLSD